MKTSKIVTLPTEEEKKEMAKNYFDSLCINQKSYLYPTKGFLAGVNKIIEMLNLKQEKSDVQQPYIHTYKLIIVTETKYNPNFGNDRICICGHPYYRHFDTYDNMEPVGCKCCECGIFKEKL